MTVHKPAIGAAMVNRPRKEVVHLAIEADAPAFTAGQFIRVGIDLEDGRVGRPYSLVNPPNERHLEIFFNVVPEGPLSSRLAALEPGDSLWLTDAANGFLTLDEVPDNARDLWMLATGTGVGPFLSMLQTGQPWQRFAMERPRRY